jgi:uncharacterized protein
VPRLNDPYILVHGIADDVVPAQMGNALHNVASKSNRIGASVVLPGEGHQPDARKLLAAFDAVRTWRASGRWDTTSLPKDVKLVPFGTGEPLNP